MFLSACKEAEAPSHEATVTATPAATATQAAITIDEPRSGDQAVVPITVKGTASVFEGTVVIAVESADGSQTFCKTFTTASEGAPGTGSFETQIAFPPPSKATDGRVQVYSESPKDGSVQNLVSVPIVISPEQPAIVVDSPLCGAEVKSPVTVRGTASVFEAALVVVIKDSLGQELARANVLASEGAPARGTFSQDLSFSYPPGGSEPGMIEAFSTSAQDGSVVSLFSVPVTLTP
ncbi:MAG: Gmad2 immunoglobulin-like domain-containing protein [Dehalococcoidia bacterium]|nr:Gmad2 immunoglobulin-like domain-containing protein [Dehalococcoidia bacterium]